MVYIYARHEIADYERWEAHHEANGETRAAHGSLGTTAFRPVDEENEVVVLQEVADDRLEEALAYYRSDEFQDALAAAGVRELVEATVLETVHEQDV